MVLRETTKKWRRTVTSAIISENDAAAFLFSFPSYAEHIFECFLFCFFYFDLPLKNLLCNSSHNTVIFTSTQKKNEETRMEKKLVACGKFIFSASTMIFIAK